MLASQDFDDHLFGSMAVLAEHAGAAGLVARRDGVAIAATGHGNDEFNCAFVLEAPVDPRTTLSWAVGELDRRGTPFMVQVPAELVDHLGRPLGELGLTSGPPTPGMARRTTTDVPELPTGLRLERVRTSEQVEAHVVACARGFGAPDPAGLRAVLRPSLRDDERVSMFNGHLDAAVTDEDLPVATSVCVLAGGVAGIYAVTVREDCRRRGLGAALTWAAVAAGAAGGAEVVVLQATTMGLPVYEAMGFVHVRSHHRFRRG